MQIPSPNKPRIGVWLTTDEVHLHPPVARGLRLVHDRLKRAGYEVVELSPPPLDSRSWILIRHPGLVDRGLMRFANCGSGGSFAGV
ncbi:hypothetical protein V8C34DRAFT_291153 [Trichoderma compactum]